MKQPKSRIVLKNCANFFRSKPNRTKRRRSSQTSLTHDLLEDRRLLATFVVTTAQDIPVSAGIAPGSLRQAVFNANSSAGEDTITFDPNVFTGGDASLIRLTSELLIAGSLTIDGSAATDVTITGDVNGDDVTNDRNITDASVTNVLADNSRVLNFDFAPSMSNLTLSSLTITGGRTSDSSGGNGGGIRFNSDGVLSLENSVVSGNSTASNQAQARNDGGGIYSASGAILLTNSTVSGNVTRNAGSTGIDSRGGGVFSSTGSITLINSSILDNSTNGGDDGGRGGGLYSSSGAIVITDSTISGNTTELVANGGGIYTSSGAITINNSVVSGNATGVRSQYLLNPEGGNGGGVASSSGAITVTNSTISENIANEGGNGGGIFSSTGSITLIDSLISSNLTGDKVSGRTRNIDAGHGGGIYASSGDITLSNSTVSGNRTGDGPRGNLYTNAISSDQIDAGNGGSGGGIFIGSGNLDLINSTISGNRSGNGGVGARPGSTLDGSGGGSFTSAGDGGDGGEGGGIFANSSSVNIVNSTIVSNYTGTGGDGGPGRDPTGDGDRGSDGNGGGVNFDSNGTLSLLDSTLSGNTATGSGGGIHTLSGDVSLINSTVSTNVASTGDGGGIFSEGFVTLTGSSVTENVGVSGGGIFAALGASLSDSNVTGNSTTGNANPMYGNDGESGRGGGIYSEGGSVTLVDSTVAENLTIGSYAGGGGIFSGRNNEPGSGEVTLINSTVSENSTLGTFAQGGGIYAGGAVVSTNSTISGNSTEGVSARGGGIFSFPLTVTLNNSTVFENSSGGAGGGVAGLINFPGAMLTIQNSIIAGNTYMGMASDFIAPDSLIVRNSVVGAVPDGLTLDGSNQTGSDASPLDPLLGPLVDNGGPTFTHALLEGSPAIDAGDNALAVDENGSPLTSDQRGETRIVDGTVDVGSFELDDSFLLGDANLDGNVNFLDISVFISLLSDSDFLDEADIDRNGVVNFLDISPFIGLLSSAGSSAFTSQSAVVALPVSSADSLVSVAEPESFASVETTIKVPLTKETLDAKNVDAEPALVSQNFSAPKPLPQASLVLVNGLSASPVAQPSELPAVNTTVAGVTPIDTYSGPVTLGPVTYSLLGSSLENSKNNKPLVTQQSLTGNAQRIDFFNESSEQYPSVNVPTEKSFSTAAELFDAHPESLDEVFDFELEELFAGN